MPPRNHSRFSFVTRLSEDKVRGYSVRYLTDRVPFRYVERSDNILHRVVQGETLYTIAGRYYRQLNRASGLWWIIADFQRQPIHDPTIQLEAGTIIVVPSLRTVLEEIFNEDRLDEEEI